ncbi:MAG: response regulator [Campylobacterota bacterium]|nr:response regulator [Campylobacterota bacterium]
MSAIQGLQEIKELTEELVVLYVEDEEDIRINMLEILNLFFKEVHTAVDGVEGVEKLGKHAFDLLITDIQMPRMNGLELVEQSKRLYPDMPVIITTAFSDQDYFIRSIDLKVDKYLLKPIEQERAKEVFFTVAKMIDDRRKAKELEIRIRQERINRMSENIVEQITNSYQSPCIVYTKGKVRYVNDAFCSLFDAELSEQFLGDAVALETLFDQRVDFMGALDLYTDEDPAKNRVSISKRQGRKIYRVVRKEITIDENDTPSLIYFFNDITLEEYQKIKIKAYSEILEEMVFDTRYRKSRKPAEKPVPETAAPPEEKPAVKEAPPVLKEVEPVEEAEPEIPADEGPKLVINEEENELLRRSHMHKTMAADYVAELDDEILQELQELDELEKDFTESILMLQEDANVEGLREMSGQLERYAHEISLLFEFEDLAYAIRSLAGLVASVDGEKLDEKMMRKTLIILDGIKSDLADWRRFIFIEQSAKDIHYLDSSLYSACLQIELMLSEEIKEMESEEDDLILF